MSRRRLYIGRLPTRATTTDVERFFRGYGRIRDIDLKGDYGFVEFEDPRDAEDAAYELNGRSLHGEKLRIELARVPTYPQNGPRVPPKEHARSRYGPPERTENRIIVENLSTRCSWQDLKDLMRKAGEVTYADAHKIRRNEAIVEFATRADMKRALDRYDGYELHGRRLKIIEDHHDSRSPSRGRKRSRSRSGGRGRNRHSESRSLSRTPSSRGRHSRSLSRSSPKRARRSPSRSSSGSYVRKGKRSPSASPSPKKELTHDSVDKQRSYSKPSVSPKRSVSNRSYHSRSRSPASSGRHRQAHSPSVTSHGNELRSETKNGEKFDQINNDYASDHDAHRSESPYSQHSSNSGASRSRSQSSSEN